MRGLAEDRRRVADEVDPELARDLGHLGRRPEAHQPLLEALRLERARRTTPRRRTRRDARARAGPGRCRRSCWSGRRRPRGRRRSSGRRVTWPSGCAMPARRSSPTDSRRSAQRLCRTDRASRSTTGSRAARRLRPPTIQRERDDRGQQDRGEDEVGPEAVLRELHPDAEAARRPDVLAEDRADDRVDDADPEAREERRQGGRPAQLPEGLSRRSRPSSAAGPSPPGRRGRTRRAGRS